MSETTPRPRMRVGVLGRSPVWLGDGGGHTIDNAETTSPDWQLIVADRRLPAGSARPGQVVLYHGQEATAGGVDPDADHTALVVALPGRVAVLGGDEIATVVAELFLSECGQVVHHLPLSKLEALRAAAAATAELAQHQDQVRAQLAVLCGQGPADVMIPRLHERVGHGL